MPYTIEFKPSIRRPDAPWVRTSPVGRVDRFYTKARAEASLCRCEEKQPSLVTHVNPLKLDPTRTLSLRRKFSNEILKTFRELQKAVRHFLVELDALGLTERKNPFIKNVQPREFEFRTDAQKLAAFNEWFRQQVDAKVLSPDPTTPAGQPWTTEFVESAYRRGQMNAFLAAKQGGAEIGDQSTNDFLRDSFGQPETMSKVQLLGTRVYEELKGISATMSTDMSRILAQGIADGRGPDVIAREMSARIASLGRSRATTIARTEIINAHAEGQLDAFGKLGIEELGLMAEWSTAGDERVCPQCAPLEGQVFTVAEARGMIPLHPNCRCSWIPSEAKPTPKAGAEAPVFREVAGVPGYTSLAETMHAGQKFTKDERDAAEWYQGSGYGPINSFHRGAPTHASPERLLRVEAATKELDKVIARTSTPEPLLLFRGGMPTLPPAGSVIQDLGYGSTSTTWERSAGFIEYSDKSDPYQNLLAIRAPAGSKALGMGEVAGFNFHHENELLLARGSKYRVSGEVMIRTRIVDGKEQTYRYHVVDLLQ